MSLNLFLNFFALPSQRRKWSLYIKTIRVRSEGKRLNFEQERAHEFQSRDSFTPLAKQYI